MIRFLSTLLIFGLPVAASAQVGTYRPGKATAVVPAATPDQCAAACAGDAGCGAWNFVRMSASPTGGKAVSGAVCEFLARDADPIASNISVSGAAVTTDPASARIVREAGGRTVRIGAPTPTPQHRVVREPAPRQAQPRAAATRPTVANARPRAVHVERPAPMFRHSLEGSDVIERPVVTPAPVIRPAPLPAPQDSAADIARMQARRQVASPAPQAPFAPASPAPPAASAPAARRPMVMPPAPPRAVPPSGSLFGGLYDDVAAPAPASASDLGDPGAPVTTATSAQDLSGLAGGQP